LRIKPSIIGLKYRPSRVFGCLIYNKQMRVYVCIAPLRSACSAMKKTVVVNLDYMRPSVGGRRSRSRSRDGSRSRSARGISGGVDEREDEELNIYELLHKDTDDDDDHDDRDDDDRDDETTDTTSDIEESPPPPPSRTHPSVKDSDYAVDSDDDLLQSVLDEPTFPMDINAILSAMNKTENNTIANLTLKKIATRRHEILSSMNLTPEKMAEFERKLPMYRVIENPYDLKHNQLIRWIPLRSLETRPYITLGGTLFRVRENPEEGVHVVTIRNVKRFVFNIKFELNVVFQRSSQEELLILRAVEYVDGDGDGDETDNDGGNQ